MSARTHDRCLKLAVLVLALALGVSSVIGGGDPLVHGLGLVALISLATVLAVMALGLLVHWKERRKES